MIYKKYYVFVLLILFFFWFALSDALWDVDISFCNSTSTLDMSGNIITWDVQSGVIISGNSMSYKIWVAQEWDICYIISNKSIQETSFKISFVDGTFTNDQRKNKACLSDSDTKYFGQYVTGYDSIITVSWSQMVQKSAKFNYPMGSDGIYHGCLVYSILDKPVSWWAQSNFTVLMRRAKFIDVLVWNHKAAGKNAITLVDFNPLSGENLSSNPKIRIYIDPADGKYVIQFQLKNVSSMDQDVSVTWSISNFIAYQKAFSEPRRLLRWETLLVTRKLDEVPYYNLKTKLDISYVPYYTFDDEKPTAWSLSESVNMWIVDTIFIMSLIWLLLFLIVFALLVMVLKNQKKRNNK